MDPARFAATYTALWAAHDLADHVVQTDHQAANKAAGGYSWVAPMAGHIGGYGTTQLGALALLRAAGVPLRPRRVLAGLAVSLGTHAFLDRRWPVVRLLRRTGSARFAHPSVVAEVELRDGDLPWFTRRRSATDPQRVTEARGPLPLHGPYLADQALHHACVVLAAGVIASG